MSLITETKKLRELEQRTREDFEMSSPIDDSDYLEHLVDCSPDMLGVMGMFRVGDAIKIDRIRDDYNALIETEVIDEFPEWLDDLLNRLQQMAELMEQESQP